MKMVVRILLILLVVIVVVAAIALGVVESKYAVLRNAPRVSHATAATAGTRVRVVVDPALAQDQIYQILCDFTPPEQRPSEWAFGKLLPQEFAILLDPDLALGDVRIKAFVNERRLGPVIVKLANENGLQGQLSARFPQVQWAAGGLTHPAHGTLLVEGSMPVSQPVLAKVSEIWAGPASADSLPIRGGHFIETVLDNRDGGAFAALVALNPAFVNSKEMQMAGGVLGKIHALRMHADPITTDEMAIQLRIECDPNGEENPAETFKFLLELSLPNIKKEIEQKHGLILEGASKVEGRDLVGDYTLTGLDAVLERAQLAMK